MPQISPSQQPMRVRASLGLCCSASNGAALDVPLALFEPDPHTLAQRLLHQQEKMSLLTKAIRKAAQKVSDDF